MDGEIAVLVVDEDERARSSMRDALGSRGVRVCTAATGEEAMRLLGAGAPFEVVVAAAADDGCGWLRRYRQEGGRVPAVVAVAAALSADVAAGLGGSPVILRPVDPEELCRLVRREAEAARLPAANVAAAARPEPGLERVAVPEKPAQDRAAPATPAPEKPAPDRPVPDRPAAEKPAPERPAAVRPASPGAEPPRPRSPAADVDAEYVSVSKAMQKVFEMVDRVADTDVPVLIRGESGVGKEVVARAIHTRSRRAGRAFVKINCAALPSELLESELFGHEKGAFTGAHQEKPGKFELADGGSIFLDELGEMHPSLQAKLLQVLQDEEFYRVGGRRSLRVDARVVVATNRDLEAEIERGQFREDLYYRLNVVSVRVPPLRERKEDLPPLVEHFCRKYGVRYAGGMTPIRPEVMRRFLEHDWPGNVRELENMVRRLVVLGDEAVVLEELSARGGGRHDPAPPPAAPEEGLKDIARRAAMLAEREAIDQMLKLTGWNKRKAAQRLKISYKALLYKIKECGICDPRLLHAEKVVG